MSYAQCLAAVNAGKDIDYDGASSPIELDATGEPALASLIVLTYGQDNSIDEAATRTFLVGDATTAVGVTPSAPPRATSPSGGPLKLGAILPLTGGLAFLGPATLAAARLAVQDINAAGGVNGLPVELSEADSGDLDDILAPDAATGFISDGVQVIIGSVSSGISLSFIDSVVAGVVMISPANTSERLTDYPDQGLDFRTVAPDSRQGRAVAQPVTGDARQRVGILAIDDDYGENLAVAVTEGLIALGVPADQIVRVDHAYDAPDFYDDVIATELLGARRDRRHRLRRVWRPDHGAAGGRARPGKVIAAGAARRVTFDPIPVGDMVGVAHGRNVVGGLGAPGLALSITGQSQTNAQGGSAARAPLVWSSCGSSHPLSRLEVGCPTSAALARHRSPRIVAIQRGL